MQEATPRVGGTLTERSHAAGSSLPWHTHLGPTLCFVCQGAFTESFTGVTLECTPGTLKITPAGGAGAARKWPPAGS